MTARLVPAPLRRHWRDVRRELRRWPDLGNLPDHLTGLFVAYAMVTTLIVVVVLVAALGLVFGTGPGPGLSPLPPFDPSGVPTPTSTHHPAPSPTGGTP
jgi:hypothetical protein